jgi:hypothetical protein
LNSALRRFYAGDLPISASKSLWECYTQSTFKFSLRSLLKVAAKLGYNVKLSLKKAA